MPTILVWGPHIDIDTWTNELVTNFERLGWTVVRSPRYDHDREREKWETLSFAKNCHAAVFLALHIAWIGGPPVEVLNAYRDAGILTCCISQDEPYRYGDLDNRAGDQAPGYDLWFTNWSEPAFLARHAAKRVVVAPNAARSSFRPSPAEYKQQIGFVGVYYSPRDPYLRAVSDLGLRSWMIPRTSYPLHPWPPPVDIAATLAPGGRFMSDSNVADINCQSKISLDIAETPSGRDRLPKNRLFEAVACGSFTLSGRCPQTEALFEDGKHLVLYDDADDLRAKALLYLAIPHARDRIAREGYEWAITRHTWGHRCAQFSREMLRDLGTSYPRNVTVVIPTRDRHELCSLALASVPDEVPVVIVDTGEKPIPAPYREATVLRAPGACAGHARNEGVKAAKTEWVQFLDDDDLLRVAWREGFVDGGASAFDRRDLTRLVMEAGVLVCAGQSVDPRCPGYLSPDRPYTSQIMVNVDAFNKVGGFDTRVAAGEERDLLDRMAAFGIGIGRHREVGVYKGGEDVRPWSAMVGATANLDSAARRRRVIV